MKQNIILLRPFGEKDLNYIVKNLENEYNFIIPEKFDFETLKNEISKAEIAICNKFNEDLLDFAPKLKMIQVPGAGVDKFHFGKLKSHGIILCNSHTNSYYVAEYAISLLFTLLKKIHLHDQKMRKGEWFRNSGKDEDKYFHSDSLLNRKIGIFGFGHIGQKIASFLSGFPNDILIYDKYIDLEEMTNRDLNWVQMHNFEDFITNSDIIFISAPLTQDTENTFDKSAFNLMKSNLILINTSRAAIVNEKALYTSLKDDKIQGAAFDVWYQDVLITDKGLKFPSKTYPFHKLNNILMSPYRAAHVFQDEPPHLIGMVENLKKYAEKSIIMNKIDLNKQC